MNESGFQARGRSMRWYEWVLMLLLLGLVAGVRADSVYKCTDAQGAVAYQSRACSPQQDETQVAIMPAPARTPSPSYGAAAEKPLQRVHVERTSRPVATRSAAVSYECRVADGQVFFRHSPCPHSVPADTAAYGGKPRGRRDSGSGARSLSVSARVVPREEACAQMHRAGAIGRAGRAHDEDVSTYERNLGHDPCH